MKPWVLVAAVLIPGGFFALAMLLFLRGARERPVSTQWLNENAYEKNGY